MNQKRIECRQCENVFPLSDENCPKCGTSVRGWKAPAAALVLGIVVVVSSLINITQLWFFLLVGLALIGVGAVVLQERRQLIVDEESRHAE